MKRAGYWVALSAGLSLVILLAAILNLSSQAGILEKIPERQKLVTSAFALGSLVLFGSAIAYLASPRRTLGIVHALCMGAMAIALFIPGWSF